jgi:hypothetical protein
MKRKTFNQTLLSFALSDVMISSVAVLSGCQTAKIDSSANSAERNPASGEGAIISLVAKALESSAAIDISKVIVSAVKNAATPELRALTQVSAQSIKNLSPTAKAELETILSRSEVLNKISGLVPQTAEYAQIKSELQAAVASRPGSQVAVQPGPSQFGSVAPDSLSPGEVHAVTIKKLTEAAEAAKAAGDQGSAGALQEIAAAEKIIAEESIKQGYGVGGMVDGGRACFLTQKWSAEDLKAASENVYRKVAALVKQSPAQLKNGILPYMAEVQKGLGRDGVPAAKAFCNAPCYGCILK